MSVSKGELFAIWRDEEIPSKKCCAMETHVFATVIDRSKYNDEQCREIGRRLRNFNSRLVEKWKSCHRICQRFEEKNKEWLDSPLLLVDSTTGPGRKEKEFANCVTRTQLRKVSSITNQASSDELMVAASSSLYKEGKRSASKIVSMMNDDEGVVKKIKTCLESDAQPHIKYTPEEALALYIDGGYTKHSYKLMQAGAKVRHANIYPAYDVPCQQKSAIPIVYTFQIFLLKYLCRTWWTIPLQESLRLTQMHFKILILMPSPRKK